MSAPGPHSAFLLWEAVLYVGEAPKDFTKPQQTIQSPNRLYKAPETLHKHINIRQNPINIRQAPKIFNKSSK